MKILGLIGVIAVLIICGCGPSGQEEGKTTESQKESTARTVIHGVTGRTAVDKGLEARQIIQEAEASRNRDLDEVFETE